MDSLLLCHSNNNTLRTLCRLCLDQSGTIDIFMDASLPNKIYALTGIKVEKLTPFPNKLCDNCCGIIQLTVEFRESVINNDKQLHDFVKLYLSPEVVPTSNEAVPVEPVQVLDESRTTAKVICSTLLQESNVQPIIRVRKDLFQMLGTNDSSVSRASVNNIIIQDKDFNKAQQSNECLETDEETDNLFIDETVNNDASGTESIDTIIIEEDDSISQHSNVCQVLPMERVGNDLCTPNESQESCVNNSNLIQDLNKDRQNRRISNDSNWEIVITCESLDDCENTSKNCIKKSNKHKNTQIIRQNTEEKEDFKLSKKIRFEDDHKYSCDQCSKFFMSKKKLYCHKRVHNKKYECLVGGCTKTFATKGDLQKHTRTHTGEKPYECDICEKKFKQKVLLRYHKGTIHGISIKKTDEENPNKI